MAHYPLTESVLAMLRSPSNLPMEFCCYLLWVPHKDLIFFSSLFIFELRFVQTAKQ